MAGHKVTTQTASEGELANLAYWYREAGVARVGDDEPEVLNERFLKAARAGLLGSALGGGAEGAAVLATHPDPLDASFTRTLASSLRLDGEPIGMLVMGPPTSLIDRLLGQLPDSLRQDPEQMQQILWGLLIGLTKLHMVAIHPEHRGRGRGARLVRHAIDVARKSKMMTIYGEYSPDRPHLRNFYSTLGFKTLAEGERLDLSVFTGFRFESYPTHGDIMFTRDI
ncbi:hypothetical protein BKG82_26660 [Mycobacteroides chelonae]|uniref:N-acetyltransferase domain-containing protein n=1 Tax=Mycobacteroides chelonae TaxID=1774 RepID=A0A1S1LHH1_MYCCH|nr:GNAT family N-acetyltransferase [Mycobacteroides chelonae]OHU47239.1 hypothetical protein BKG82_26660 [Mycobacteroides chelonae]